MGWNGEDLGKLVGPPPKTTRCSQNSAPNISGQIFFAWIICSLTTGQRAFASADPRQKRNSMFTHNHSFSVENGVFEITCRKCRRVRDFEPDAFFYMTQGNGGSDVYRCPKCRDTARLTLDRFRCGEASDELQ